MPGLEDISLSQAWPAERVLLGLRVSKSIQKRLLADVEHVVMVACRSRGAGLFPENISAGFARFAHRRLKIELSFRDFRSPKAEEIAAGMKLARELGFLGEIVKLDLSRHCYRDKSPLLELLDECLMLSHLEIAESQLCGLLPGHGGRTFILSLANVLRQRPNLTHLNLSRNDLPDDDIALVVQSLRSCTFLRFLDLSSNRAASLSAAALADMFGTCTALEALSLGRNQRLSSPGVTSLAHGLTGSFNLRLLDLCHTRCDDEGAATLAATLPRLTALTVMNIAGNSVTADGFQLLGEALGRTGALLHLDVGWNKITADGAMQLARGVGACNVLEGLCLEGNSLGPQGISELTGVFPQCSRLARLGLSNTALGPEGMQELRKAVRGCRGLRRLEIEANGLEEEGAAALACLLRESAWLQQLDAADNCMGSAGAARLAESLSRAERLTALDVKNNGIGPEGAERLAEALRDCGSLQVLNASGGQLGACAMARLIAAEWGSGTGGSLLLNNCLTDCQGLSQGPGSFEDVAAAVGACRGLARLSLAGNRFDSAEATELRARGSHLLTLALTADSAFPHHPPSN